MATAHSMAPPRTQLGPLGWIALIPAIAVLAHGEWSLAVACGVHPYVAVGVPAALDIYAIRALRAGREVLPVVLVMVAVNGASHLISTGLITVTPGVVIAVSAVPALVMWRVHAIGTHDTHTPTARPTGGPSDLPIVIHVPPSAAAYLPPRPTTPPAIEQGRPTAPAASGSNAPKAARRPALVAVEHVPDDDHADDVALTHAAITALMAEPIPASLDRDRPARIVAQLYRHLGYVPETREIAAELKAEGCSYSGGTPRDVRARARHKDPSLKRYPRRSHAPSVLTNA